MEEHSPVQTGYLETAEKLLQDLFPLCRSISGKGVRQTLSALKSHVDFRVDEISSGTRCYDWEVPLEWEIDEAFIEDSSGKRIVDFSKNNLHIASYSVPFEGVLPFNELRPHLVSLPALPSAIPYRTLYYTDDWAFCLSHDQLTCMSSDESYRVVIKSRKKNGSITYGEKIVRGTSDKEFFFSCYSCHPSLANDSLSGVVLWCLLMKHLETLRPRHTYRGIIVPETIGAIAYLARNETAMKRITGGYVLTTVGGPGAFGYKESFRGTDLVDRAARMAFRDLGITPIRYPFDVNGSDERQYSSPGFRIPVGIVAKDKFYEYPFYHTSLDNLDFVKAPQIIETFEVYKRIIEILECDQRIQSRNPHCEPMLGKRGLLSPLGGAERQGVLNVSRDALSWVMFSADGSKTLLDIAETSGQKFCNLRTAAETLQKQDLIELI